MPTIIKAIVIPADDDQPLRVEDIGRNNYLVLADLVGGPIEGVFGRGSECTFYFNEDGHRLELEENERATLLLRAMHPAFITEAPLVGDVVMVGSPTSSGNDTSVPEALHTLLFDTTHFAVEWSADKGTGWKRMSATFDKWMLAYMLGVYTLSKFDYVTAVRVIPA